MKRLLARSLTAVALAFAAGMSAAQETADPASLFKLSDALAPSVAGGSADIADHETEARIVGLFERFEAFRKAGHPMPDVARFDAYAKGTLIEAAGLIEGVEDDCKAAADLTMFLNARVADTNIWDAIGTVDRPLWMVTKVLATMTLPDEVGIGGDALDFLAGLKNRFARIGPVWNTIQSAQIVREHMMDTVAVRHGTWAEAAYREARDGKWTPERVALETVDLQARSQTLLQEMNDETAGFEAAIETEQERNQAAMASIDKAYESRTEAIAEDERTGGERRRREQWLRDNQASGAPKPGVGVIIDPQRNPSEISYEWAITETEAGGKYYREERAVAFQELELRRIAEKLAHEATLQKMAYDYDRRMEDRLAGISELQAKRSALQDMALPVARGRCEDIAKPAAVREKMPEIGLETVLGLPHDELMSVLDFIDAKPSTDTLNCVCRRGNYGSPGTTQMYHPSTKDTMCSTPGGPCIVSGFGCMRYPLPSGAAIWKDCAAADAGPVAAPITQAIVDRLNRTSDGASR